MRRAAVITISDSRSRGEKEDAAGPAAARELAALGLSVVERRCVPDDVEAIRAAVRALVGRVDVIVTSGGTGVAPRDVTPEAIGPLFEKTLPGFGEIMRTGAYSKTPLSIISRGGAGLIGGTLVVLLPGSPRAVRDGLGLVGPAIRHLLDLIEGGASDCQSQLANES